MKMKMITLLVFIFSNNNCLSVDNISYIFAPGCLTSEVYMSRYLPSFVASNGEHVTCLNGIEVLKEPVSSCNFCEIDFYKEFEKTVNPFKILKNLTKQIIFFVTKSANAFFDIKVSNDKRMISLRGHSINISKINFGQNLDIDCFRNCFTKHCSLINKRNHYLVLYGMSRGAATIFNFLALDKPKNVKAIICEGIFDSIPNLLKYKFPKIHFILLSMLERLTSFKTNGISPIGSINEISLDIPILLITSLKDKIVPFACTVNLYKKLRDIGHKKVHLLILNKAGHSSYVSGSDKEIYEQVVHTFYKYYGLPYIDQKAKLTKKYFFDVTQPLF